MLASLATSTFVIHGNAATLLLTFIVPVVVALLTKSTASASVKAAVMLVLSAAVTFLKLHQGDHGDITIGGQAFFDFAITTAIALASYLGFWKPVTAVNDKAAPTVGIG